MISIVIPSFDNDEQLGRCVTSIKDTCQYEYEIIVMDNGARPLGYVDPTNRGLRAARGDILIALNDDVIVPPGWDEPLVKEFEKGTWVFCPYSPTEEAMKAVGWFLCFSRRAYTFLEGFDPRFVLWCGDIDLIKRCENAKRPIVKVDTPSVQHQYSATTSHPQWQEVILEWGRSDIAKYKLKWGSDPNQDKVV